MIWTALWIAWGLAFVGIEGAALRNDNDGTLSVHLRRWFRVDTHLGRTVWLVVSGSLFAVFVDRGVGSELGPDQVRCHLMISDQCMRILDYATVTADRLDTGGSYARGGIAPACAPCQSLQGALVTQGRWPLVAS